LKSKHGYNENAILDNTQTDYNEFDSNIRLGNDDQCLFDGIDFENEYSVGFNFWFKFDF